MVCAKTLPWDTADHLTTGEDRAECLTAAFEDGDIRLILASFGDIARAKGMANIARDSGLEQESLSKALSPDGNPEFAAVLKVIAAPDLRLQATADGNLEN